jgi:hypothetical protein
MRKAIVVIAGDSSSKTKFDQIAKTQHWVRNLSSHNFLTKIAKDKLYWDGEKGQLYYKFISGFSSLVNECFGFERNYINEEIEKFNQHDCDKMIFKDLFGVEKGFETFVLVIHDLTKELTEELKNSEGIFDLFVTSHKTEKDDFQHDFVIENDSNFEEKVLRTLKILTN